MALAYAATSRGLYAVWDRGIVAHGRWLEIIEYFILCIPCTTRSRSSKVIYTIIKSKDSTTKLSPITLLPGNKSLSYLYIYQYDT